MMDDIENSFHFLTSIPLLNTIYRILMHVVKEREGLLKCQLNFKGQVPGVGRAVDFYSTVSRLNGQTAVSGINIITVG